MFCLVYFLVLSSLFTKIFSLNTLEKNIYIIFLLFPDINMPSKYEWIMTQMTAISTLVKWLTVSHADVKNVKCVFF